MFQFVSSGPLDRNTRKKLRSHVMKGKNAGKRVHRASRLDLARRTAIDMTIPRFRLRRLLDADNSTDSSDEHGIPQFQSESVSRNLSNIFLTFGTPMELSPGSLSIINHCMFYPEICMNARPAWMYGAWVLPRY